jgi:thiosulfate/3-mercaptopyruvate sulfurtransferase
VRLFLAFILAFSCGTAAAAFSGQIVDAAFVAKALARGAIVWDVRSKESYFDGHIPGAVNIGHVAQVLVDEKGNRFLPIEVIAARLGGAGIDLKREIVVYGDAGGTYPYFAEFALDYFGAQKVSVFHDGFEGWKAARRPVSTAPVTRKPVKVRPFANPSMLATLGEVEARVGLPGVQFVDVRRPREFNGDESETLHGGHIPGALNIPYEEMLGDMRLLKTAALRKLYAGLDRRKETIVYCHIGLRAAMSAAVLTRLGFRSVRLYQGSWLEYGNDADAPFEN